jgi:glycine cleavage system H protein
MFRVVSFGFRVDWGEPADHHENSKETKPDDEPVANGQELGAKNRMPYPTDLKYTKEHEWIKVEGSNATIGITDYAQEALGDIVFVELPKPGSEITAGKTFGTVESVKAVSDLYAPASATVTAVNGELASAPEKINKDANHTWMIQATLKNPADLGVLLSAADYEKFISEEAGR